MNINLEHCGDYYVPEQIKGGICVDIGANCGSFLLKYCNFFSKIHYYEPITQLFNIIDSRLNQYKHIQGFNEAVTADDNLTVDIHLHSNKDSGSSAIKSEIISINHKDDWSDTVIQNKVKTVSLEKIFERLDNQDIDYLKMDCETSEYFILMNKDLSKIKHLGIEIHNQMGKENWDRLISHILKYFNNPQNHDLSFTDNYNKELYFCNKNI